MSDRDRPVTGEVLSGRARRTPSPGRPLTQDDVGVAFRNLANEHVAGVNRRADHEALWARLHRREALRSIPLEAHNDGRNVRRLFGSASTRTGRIALLAAALTGVSAVGFTFIQSSGLFDGDPGAPQAGAAASLSLQVSGGSSSGAGVRHLITGESQVIASETDPVSIQLSDQSAIRLEPHTTLRLTTVVPTPSDQPETGPVASSSRTEVEPPSHAQLAPRSLPEVVAKVAQGKIAVELQLEQSRRYNFHAGSYLVRVVGSAFTLEYLPDAEVLHVSGVEGNVEVLSPQGVHRVTGGQTLRLADAELSDASPDGSPEQKPTPKAVGSPATPETDDTPPPPPSKTPESSTLDFAELGARGEFKAIVTVARQRGITQVLETESPRQLHELAQAARYTGQLALAEKTWRTMRARFAGQPSAINAGFFLGRLAEQRGQLPAALSHFEAYLRESPQGVYAPEAWGRKLQVIQSTSGIEAAKPVARAYLKRYPDGAYAKSARTLLQ